MGWGTSAPDAPSKVSAQVTKELSRMSQVEDTIRIHSRYHRLPKRISDDYLLTEDVLGRGMSGNVFVGISKASQRRVAVKSLCMRTGSKEKRIMIASEIAIHLSVDHPNIATLIDAYESEEHIEMVTECMDGGSLIDLRQSVALTETQVVLLVEQMLLAVQYLHNKNIVHRDLKPENFLVQNHDRCESSRNVKLIDFGISKHIRPDELMSTMNATGTQAYTAPEVFRHFYNAKCDVWSLGVITFVLLVNYIPFYGDQKQITAMILRGRPLNNGPKERWNAISDDAKDFLAHMFVMSPCDRISAREALKHRWMIHQEHAQQNPAPLEFAQSALCMFAGASQFRRACMALMAWSPSLEERDQLRMAFVELDTHGTGLVDVEALVDKVNLPADKKQQLSGALGTICSEGVGYSDFLAAMVCTRTCEQIDLVHEVFRRFDISQSGVVGEKELHAIFGDSFDCAAVLSRFPDSKITVDDLVEYLSSNADPTSPDFQPQIRVGSDPISPIQAQARSKRKQRIAGA